MHFRYNLRETLIIVLQSYHQNFKNYNIKVNAQITTSALQVYNTKVHWSGDPHNVHWCCALVVHVSSF
jgi:hypothetical protein